MDRFNWKLIIGMALALALTVIILVFGLKPERTPHDNVNSGTLPKAPNVGSTLDQFPRDSGAWTGDYDLSRKGDLERGVPLSVKSELYARKREEGSDRDEKQYPDNSGLVWPEGIGPDDVPPWMRDRMEDYLEEIDDVRNETPSRKRTPESHTVFFVNGEPDPVTGYPYSDMVFDPLVKRLYALFPCDSTVFDDREKVLAKWTLEDNSEILFEGLEILNSTPFNYIWWEDSFWSPGKYSVEIYGLEEDLPLLAWGTFEISDLTEHTGFAGLYAVPDDPVSRQSFYPEEEIYLRVNYSSNEDRQVQMLITRVADGSLVNGGVVSFPPGIDRDFTVALTDLPNPLEPGFYVLELFSFPEPRNIMGRNVFNIVE